MLPITIVSVISYILKGRFETDTFGIYALSAGIGGFLGSVILEKIKPTVIKKLFAALVIWSGINLIIR